MMHDIPKDPTDWDATVWGWVALMIAFGGVYNWMMARRQGKKSASVVSFLGELTLCEVVGIPVFMAIHGGTDTAVGISVAFAIAAGHYGTRFVCKAEALANAYACKVMGISQEELRKFEADANEAANLAGCFDFGIAFTIIKRGEAVRYIAWPENQWVTMPVSGKIEVKATDIWAKPNAEFARRQSDQTVLVLPCMSQKLADGTIINGWTPTALELIMPGWMRVELPATTEQKPEEPPP